MTTTATKTTRATRARRTARAPKATSAAPGDTSGTPGETKLDILIRLLARDGGATIAELSEATGWKTHSVRGALAGALRKKGVEVTSEVTDGVRRYRTGAAS